MNDSEPATNIRRKAPQPTKTVSARGQINEFMQFIEGTYIIGNPGHAFVFRKALTHFHAEKPNEFFDLGHISRE